MRNIRESLELLDEYERVCVAIKGILDKLWYHFRIIRELDVIRGILERT